MRLPFRGPRRSDGRGLRLYFATDIHGSELCWRKFLNAAAHYRAGALVMGGDVTGKALVPIVEQGGSVRIVRDEALVDALRERLAEVWGE